MAKSTPSTSMAPGRKLQSSSALEIGNGKVEKEKENSPFQPQGIGYASSRTDNEQ